jgi:hypothetical protein
MKKLIQFPLKTVLPAYAFFLASAFAADADAPSTLLATAGKLVFHDAMTVESEGKAEVKWRTAKGKWTRSSESVSVEELESDKHGAVGRVPVKLSNFVLAVDVRLDGAKVATISINDAKEHVARVGLSPNGFLVRKDDHDHDGPDLAVTFFNSPEKLEAGKWHSVVLEMVGDTMLATLDGKITGWGSHELFKVEKANPGLTVAGQSASFRNFRIWEAAAEPKEGWNERKAALPVPNTKPSQPAPKKPEAPK